MMKYILVFFIIYIKNKQNLYIQKIAIKKKNFIAQAVSAFIPFLEKNAMMVLSLYPFNFMAFLTFLG